MEYTFCIVKVYFKLYEFRHNEYTESIQQVVYKMYTKLQINYCYLQYTKSIHLKYTKCIQTSNPLFQ